MSKLKSLSIAQMVLPQRSLYRRRIPLSLSDIPVVVSNCCLYCHLLFAMNPLSIHYLCFIKSLARPMSLYKPCRQEWLGRGTCLNSFSSILCIDMTVVLRPNCRAKYSTTIAEIDAALLLEQKCPRLVSHDLRRSNSISIISSNKSTGVLSKSL